MSRIWGAVAGQPFFNIAEGGTVSTFSYGGYTWRRHLFTAVGASTFYVRANPMTFRITFIAGGGQSGYADPPTAGGAAGGSGGGKFLEQALPAGPIAIQVGRNNTGQDSSVNDSIITGVGTVGGGGHGNRTMYNYNRSDGRPGTWGGNSNGGNGRYATTDSPYDPSSSLRTLIDGTVGTWGKYGAASSVGNNDGKDGMVCFEYRIT